MMNGILFFLALAALFLISYLYYKVFQISPEESVTLAVLTIPVVIYITGYFRKSEIGIGILFVLVCLGILSLFFIKVKKKRTEELRGFFTPAIVIFSGMVVVIYVLFRHCFVCNFDEFTQWAKAIDYMLANNKLPMGADFEGYSTMFSSTTLFQYAMNYLPYKVLGTSSVGSYYTSSVVFWLIAVMLPLSGRGWNKWKSTVLYFIAIFMIANWMYVHPYYNMYPDQAVALWAGGFLGWYFFSETAKGKRLKVICPVLLINLAFMKTMVGPLFVAVALLAIGMDYLNKKDLGVKELLGIWKKNMFTKKGIIGFSIVILFVGISLFTISASGNDFFMKHLFHIDTANNRVPLTVKSGIKNAFVAVNLEEGFWNISYVGFFVMAIVLFLLLYFFIFSKEEKKRMTRIYVTYFLGFGFYFLILIYAFLTVFGYADSVRTGSINRYFSCYMLLGSIPILAPFFLLPTKKKTNKHGVRRICAIVLMMIVISANAVSFVGDICPDYNTNRTFLKLKDISNYKNQIDKITHGTGKIFMINQSRAIYYVVAADYEFKDQITRDGMCYYFPEKPKDIEGINVLEYHDISEFPSMLDEGEYEYIWIYKANSYFRKNFRQMFDLEKYTIKKGNIYKVIKKDGKIQIELINKINQITR